MQNPKEEYIGCLSLILKLWLVWGVISLFISIPLILMSPMPVVAIGVVVCKIASLVGLAFLLQFKKIGFYLFVGSYIVLLIAVLLVPEFFKLKWIFRIILGLLLFLTLMAIKNKKTKMNGYQFLGITESNGDFEAENTTKDNVQIESIDTDTDTDTSISEGAASAASSTASSSDTTPQNNDLEPISKDEIEKEEAKDALASLVKENDNKNEIIINTTKNDSSESSPLVVSPVKSNVDVKKPKNRINRITVAVAVVLAVVLLISGVVISLSQCSRKTPEEIFKEAKTLIDNNQYEKGIAELEKIQENHIPAKALLGHLYTMNDSIQKDMIRGEQLLKDAFEKNDTSAGIDLVYLYFDRGDWKATYTIAEKLATLDCTKGARALSCLYCIDKMGGEDNKHRDFSKAEFYALKVAEKDAFCCHYLGCIYSEGGHGIKKDHVKAFYWWNHGAKLGDANCFANFGWLYLNGYGVEMNDKKAFISFKKAIEIDTAHYYAYSQIANMFKEGYYVKANKDSAKYYYQKAAKYGDEEAAVILENNF